MQRTVFAGIAVMAAMTSVNAVLFENELKAEHTYVEVDNELDTEIPTKSNAEKAMKSWPIAAESTIASYLTKT